MRLRFMRWLFFYVKILQASPVFPAKPRTFIAGFINKFAVDKGAVLGYNVI